MALTRAWLATAEGKTVCVLRCTWFAAREVAATLLGVEPGRVTVKKGAK